jgi:gamma-glutamyltranspeptidase/glutathione hydrolase
MIPRSYRTLVMGRRGVVASNHPLATQAGLDVLRRGGSAADCAVAVSLTLGVVEPFMSGLGADGFYHHHSAKAGRGLVYNGSAPAQAGLAREQFLKSGLPADGAASAGLPGALAALGLLHAEHGRMPWQDLCEAAIGLARDGFEVSHTYRRFAAQAQVLLLQDAVARDTYLADRQVPELGAVIVQPALARTLSDLAENGVSALVDGGLAERFVESARSIGASFTDADLRSYRPEVQEPISRRYRDYDVRTTGPNSMGFVLLEELGIVEHFDMAKLGHGSADSIHVLVEAKKRAFLDREAYAADPRGFDIPLERLLSVDHCGELAAGIDMTRAAALPLVEPEQTSDTTYFCIVDDEGNVVSAIQSLNGAFGAGVVAGDTGILLNNRLACWHLREGHPNVIAPGKRVRHTMNAPILYKDDKPWAVLGTPGADDQVQVNLQVIVAMIDHGLDPQQAVETVRWSSSQHGQAARWPHGGNDELTIEAGLSGPVLKALSRRGHRVAEIPALTGPCSVQCVRILDNGVLMAGSDPRRDGWAGAF